MVEFLNLIAAEPDIARVPMMIDSSKWEVIEAGPEVRAGQADRQLDLDEGGRGGVPRSTPGWCRAYGAAVVVMAFDEQGQADTLGAQGRDLHPRLQAADRGGRLPARGHHLRPQHLRRRHRHRGARQLRRRLHRGDAADHARRCRTPTSRAASRTCRFSFRGNEPVREAMHAVFLYHAIQAGMDMGIVNAGQLAVYDIDRPGAARGLRGRDPQPPRATRPSGCSSSPSASRATAGSEAQGQGPRPGATSRSRSGIEPRAGQRHHRIHRRRHRGGAAGGRAAAARHRRPADGRHERRRRPVRRGQDVPAAGGEVGPRDEAGGRLPAALHGGGEATPMASAAGARVGRQDPDGDGQGRRPRHRQEHRRRRARLQQLRDHRPRRHGAGDRRSCETAREREGRHHRPVRPDHAVARRDGACRRRDGARGLRHPAADRRRDHQPRAHGGEDPPALQARARRSMSPTPAAPSAWSPACCRRTAKAGYVDDDPGRIRARSPRRTPRAEADKQRLPLAAARANALQARLGDLRAAEADASSARASSTTTTSPSSPATSTGRRSSRPGS